jgi:hypothetical protein
MNEKDLEEDFHNTLANMKRACLSDFHDPKYWNVVLEDGETILPSEGVEIRLLTKDGFVIMLRFMDRKPFMCNFNGYLLLPRGLHLEQWLQENPCYEDLSYYLDNMEIDLTYGSVKHLKYGWDHAHFYDAKLCIPMSQQVEKRISGPVQVLEEARSLIRCIMSKENDIIQEKKQEQMSIIKEDLIKAALHPKRIEAWVNHGFESFT